MITAGLARKPGMSRMDLIEVNAKIVRNVVENVVKHAPEAVLIVVSNPLDEMTALAAKVSGFPSSRVSWARRACSTPPVSRYFVAEKLGVPVGSVTTLTLGSHGDTMVPVPVRVHRRTASRWTRCWPPRRSRPWSPGPATAAARSSRCSRPARRTTRRPPPPPGWRSAVAEDSGAVMPVCAWVDGEYGISGVYLGVEAEIGAAGVRRVVERDLSEPRWPGCARPPRPSAPSRPT